MATFTAELIHISQRLFLPKNDNTYQARSFMHSSPSPSTSSAAASSQASGSRGLQYILIGLLAIPVVIYYVTIYKNAYNFPFEDDFNSALSFISDYSFSGLSAWGKLKLIFSQYNEHRIVFDRLIFLTDYAWVGQLNFRHLILIGNLAPLLIGYLFMRVVFRSIPMPQKLIYLLPVAFTLFSFQYWDLSTWSMAALQNLYVIPFAMFGLYSLCQPGQKAFVLACGAAVLATYTSGNGLFTFIAGALLLLFMASYKRLVLWVGLSAVTIGLYFLNYIRPPYHPDIADSLFNHTGRAISYFFSLIGAMVGPGRPTVAILFGIVSLLITLGLLGYLWYTKRLNAHLPLVGWIAFLYLTCLSLMASRSGMGVVQAFSPRYGIVVVMLFATQAVLAVESITHHYGRMGVLISYLGVSLFFYFSATNQGNRHRIADRAQQLRYSSALYNDNPANLSLHWGNLDVARPVFEDAYRKGIYQVPNLTFSALKSQPQPFDSALLVATHNVTYELKPYISGNFVVMYRDWALLNKEQPRDLSVQIVANSPSNCYAFDTYAFTLDDADDHALGRQYTHPGFTCVLDKRDLKPGHYVLWLCLTTGTTKAYQPLDVVLDV
ncbi:hypothetical protein [Spirosoma sp. KNUC1025]|uniref:hypothetical protein n=1 Tax=Spirosoma sp. KNUC1025 TaxID=2894082 RepID=UPI00386BB434|nr:hypothetical protein LN737_04830 [Spirosoma sp. KNUC1025]